MISDFQLDQSAKAPFDFLDDKTRLEYRVQMRAAITQDLHIGEQRVIPEKHTFFEGAFYLQDKDKKARADLGGVFWAVPATSRPASTPRDQEVLPARSLREDIDDRWQPIALDGGELFWACGRAPFTVSGGASKSVTKDDQSAIVAAARVPGQHPGILIRRTEERSQHLAFHPTWANVIVANHRGDDPGDYSTILADVDGEDLADDKDGRAHHMAAGDTGWRVATVHKSKNRADPGESCAVEWWGGNSPHQAHGAGRGLFASTGLFGQRGTLSHGYACESGGGPLSPGDGKLDKHAVFVNSDGELISQGHLSLSAPWFADELRDAPPSVDPSPYVPTRRAGRLWETVLRYDPQSRHDIFGPLGAGGTAEGLFRWQTYVPLYIPPIEDPPQPPPPLVEPQPKIPGGVVIPSGPGSESELRPIPPELTNRKDKRGIRTVLHSWLELATDTGAFRARHSRTRDLRYVGEPSEEDLYQRVARAPIVLRHDVIGAEKGSVWDHTEKPKGGGRYYHGTASGGWWLMPPEWDSDLAELDASFPSRLPEASDSLFGLWNVELHFGRPLRRGTGSGGSQSGWFVRRNRSGAEFVIGITSSTGGKTERLSMTTGGSLTLLASGSSLTAPLVIGGTSVSSSTHIVTGSGKRLDLVQGDGANWATDRQQEFQDEDGTIALLEANQTFSGDLTLSGAVGHTGSNLGFFSATPTTQAGTISSPSGGATQDAEARTAITAILALLGGYGLMAS